MNISNIGSYIGTAAQSATKTQNRQNVQGGDSFAAMTGTSSASGETASTKFMSYMKETPAQRFMDSWLAQHGISKDDFNKMSDDAKQKIIAQMKQEMEQKAKEQIGSDDHKPVDLVV